MAYRILLTSLYEIRKKSPILYFYVKEENRDYFCDAILSTEAIAKYVLARYEVNEIIAIGNRPAFDVEKDSNEIELREGLHYLTSDLDDLSAYSMFNYRIAQFIDDLKIDQQDLFDLIGEEDQAKAAAYVNDFCKNIGAGGRESRLFEDLAKDKDLYKQFVSGLEELTDDDAFEDMLMWTKGYLFKKLKDTCKLDILRENEDVKISYVSATIPNDGILPVESMLQIMSNFITADHDKIEIIVALDNNDVTGSFVLMNLLDIADKMHGDRIEVTNVFGTVEAVNAIAEEIRNDTDEFGITELTAAMRSFLRYGKADMLIDYWNRKKYHNEMIERALYAMNKVDMGLSLCSIKEMESGIITLRELFADKSPEMYTDDYVGKLFQVFADGIRLDYGKLMEGDEIDFIEMVKWGYRKNFYQQTLTLIESRVPQVFVRRGIYYYCDDEEKKGETTRIFAKLRNELRHFEYWKMDRLDHYFIKTYAINNFKPKGKSGDAQREMARFRMGFLENTDPEKLTAYTACDDRQAVEDLLYAYFHIGNIRNNINHAEDRFGEETSLIVSDKDESNRLKLIKESIEYFIKCFEDVTEKIGDKEFNSVIIEAYEVKSLAKKMEREDHGDRGGRGERGERSDRGEHGESGEHSDRGERVEHSH